MLIAVFTAQVRTSGGYLAVPVAVTNGVLVSPGTAFSAAPTVTSVTGIWISGTANPAAGGAGRLANAEAINARNAANGADVSLLSLNSSNVAFVGGAVSGGARPSGLFLDTATGSNIAMQVNGSSIYQFNANGILNVSTLLFGSTAPTISSGFGTSPSIASNNGTTTFRVNVGTGGTATTGTVGMPTASTGWNCVVQDFTNNTVTRQTGGTTTSVVVTAAAAWAASDILIFNCAAF